ncbi:MAG TPA: ABC transporter permease [Chloroflexota bacterium]|nr:ABC transporter permease [Chloroflexota bacterium]
MNTREDGGAPLTLPEAAAVEEPAISRRSRMRVLSRNRLAVAGLLIILFWVVISALSPLLPLQNPYAEDLAHRLQGPGIAGHLLGTDANGQDVFSRLLHGGIVSIGLGAAVVVLGGTLGLLIGIVAGYYGGWVDEVLMRIAEVVLAFPVIVLAIAVAAGLGSSERNAVLSLLVVWWPGYARVGRGLVLGIKEQEYVTAVRAIGQSTPGILWRTVLPNMISAVVVLATIDLGNAITTLAALSFIGVGVPPNTPEWGVMISQGSNYFDQWWIATFPGLALISVIMGCNFFGDGLRDALDPRTR